MALELLCILDSVNCFYSQFFLSWMCGNILKCIFFHQLRGKCAFKYNCDVLTWLMVECQLVSGRGESRRQLYTILYQPKEFFLETATKMGAQIIEFIVKKEIILGQITLKRNLSLLKRYFNITLSMVANMVLLKKWRVQHKHEGHA